MQGNEAMMELELVASDEARRRVMGHDVARASPRISGLDLGVG